MGGYPTHQCSPWVAAHLMEAVLGTLNTKPISPKNFPSPIEANTTFPSSDTTSTVPRLMKNIYRLTHKGSMQGYTALGDTVHGHTVVERYVLILLCALYICSH